MTYYLLFIFILDQGKDVRQKNKFKRFSYPSSKWVVKQWRPLATSAMHLAQELLMKVQYSGGSRSFAKEMRALKMSTKADHRTDNKQRKGSSKPVLLQLRLEVVQDMNYYACFYSGCLI